MKFLKVILGFLFLTCFFIFQLPIILFLWVLGWIVELILHDGSGSRSNPITEWASDPWTWRDYMNALKSLCK